MWWSIAFDFFKTDFGKQVVGGIGVVLLILSGWWYVNSIKGERDDALNAQKDAENNVVLISREFELLYETHSSLENEFVEQGKYHKYSINLLNEIHSKDLEQMERITIIKTEIKNVKDEDDGEISNVLNATLDAIGLLD